MSKHADHECNDSGIHDFAHCPIEARRECAQYPSPDGQRAMYIIERLSRLPDAAELRKTARTTKEWEALLAERER